MSSTKSSSTGSVSKPSFFKRLRFGKRKRKSKTSKEIQENESHNQIFNKDNRAYASIEDLEQMISEKNKFFEEKIENLQRIIQQQKVDLSEARKYCMENEIAVEEKTCEIYGLTMEIKELESSFAKERKAWYQSNQKYFHSTAIDDCIFETESNCSTPTSSNKSSTIIEYPIPGIF